MNGKFTVGSLCMMCFLFLARGSKVKNVTHGVLRHIRSIGFPEGSGMGVFFAVGMPLDIPDKTVLFSFYFEANYALPNEWNSSYYNADYFYKRSLDRRLAYSVLESKLESAGYPGRSCLLKTICETTKSSLSKNGFLGDVLQILFTPSTSQDENLPEDVKLAEGAEDCDTRYKDCSVSLLDLISHHVAEENVNN